MAYFRRKNNMAHLKDFINDVIEKGLAKKTSHEQDVYQLIKAIDDEQVSIKDNYSKIGELYVAQYKGEAKGTELGALVEEVKASEKKIKDSKLKIGEVLGFNFCPTCLEEVDEDALYCNNCGAKMPVKVMPGMVICNNCNKAVREGVRFCTNCGHSMIEEPKPEGKVCPNCGWTTDDMSINFCDKCGRRLEGGEEEEEKKEEEKVPTNKVCPNCGWTVFDIETTHCEKCGRRLEVAE